MTTDLKGKAWRAGSIILFVMMLSMPTAEAGSRTGIPRPTPVASSTPASAQLRLQSHLRMRLLDSRPAEASTIKTK